jgi:hypothetical protein
MYHIKDQAHKPGFPTNFSVELESGKWWVNK